LCHVHYQAFIFHTAAAAALQLTIHPLSLSPIFCLLSPALVFVLLLSAQA
jgi:hypothetical protein